MENMTRNQEDMDCGLWADQGEYVKNSRFMFPACRNECIAKVPRGHDPEHN